VSPKDDLLNRPYLIKKTTRGGGGEGQIIPILRQHSLWTAPNSILQLIQEYSKSPTRKLQWI
jgi:hypothetical protein